MAKGWIKVWALNLPKRTSKNSMGFWEPEVNWGLVGVFFVNFSVQKNHLIGRKLKS